MSTYIFLCSSETIEECLRKKLFGGTRRYQKTVPHVDVGDVLFLYDYESKELHGEFVATSSAAMDIVKNAWGKHFPWQVRVRRTVQYDPLSRRALETLPHFKFGGRGRGYAQAVLDDALLRSVRELFRHPPVTREETQYLDDNPAMIRTQDGHYVRSVSEQRIDDWLFEHGVMHVYEKKIKGGFCDFYIPLQDGGVYIEFWGLDTPEYNDRKARKIASYHKSGTDLVELTQKDLPHLDTALGRFLPQKSD